MHAYRAILIAGSLVAGSAGAQSVEPAPSATPMEARARSDTPAFASSFQPFPRIHGGNEAETPDPKLFDNYRTDPKLVAGVDFGAHVGIEAGYANLMSRGFHYAGPERLEEQRGALGIGGMTSYLAAKVTAPVHDRLSLYGKLGVSYAQRDGRSGLVPSTTSTVSETGPYASVGASYKVSDKATLSGQFQQAGDTARRWGNATNATGFGAKLKLGF